jgi:hypothetical protein
MVGAIGEGMDWWFNLIEETLTELFGVSPW